MKRLSRIAAVAALAVFWSSAAYAAGWGHPGRAPDDTPSPPPPPPPSHLAAPAVGTAPAAPTLRVGAPELLRGADAALAAGDLVSARLLFERLLRETPLAPEAEEARRALKVIALSARQSAPAPAPVPAPGIGATVPAAVATSPATPASSPAEAIVVREEPYSTATSERLRLTAWEKLDFGVTAFLYGMSLGFSYSVGVAPSSTAEATTPIALGATAYALGAVAYLKLANPDRGDLPLMLGITSYIPTTTLLLSNFAFDNPSDKKVAITTVAAGVASIPLAIAVTATLNLDPGDTQLVRDAGFWGLALSTAGAFGFGGETISGPGFEYTQEPSGRFIAGMGLVGLFGGLGLGALAAAGTEISLERVRVTTWGGYGGAVVGGLVGASLSGQNGDAGVFRGVTVGATLGLLVTFLTTRGLDGIPPNESSLARSPSRPAALRWMPSLNPNLTPITGANGVPVPALGVAGVL